jgi:5,5'-dehydrodivanillate O-demethylase
MSDRPNEHLGRSDRGVAMVRQRLLEEMERVQRGEDPKATVRDPDVAKHIELPIVGKEYFKNGLPSEAIRGSNAPYAAGMKRFPFLCDQPQSIKKQFEEATGFRLTDATY